MNEETDEETTTLEAEVSVKIEERLTDYCAAHGVTPDEVVSVALLEFLDVREAD
jgi:hypothetical protein